MDTVRRHIIISGDVQGVGLRYHLRSAADRFGVTGWVRNLYDGTVEAELEGLRADIDAVLDHAVRGSWAQVSEIRIQTVPVQGGYSFEVR